MSKTDSKSHRKLGIIAGSGELPRQVIEACTSRGQELFVVAIEDAADSAAISNTPHIWLNLGKVGKAVKAFKKEGITDIVLVGKVGRPPLSALQMDFGAMRLLSRLATLKNQGDDAVFSTIITFLENQGLNVVGVDDVLSELRIEEGLLGKVTLDEPALNDIRIGKKVIRTIGELDIGQAVVVQRGLVLGIEGPEGTDKLMERCKELHTEGPGGILIKMKKPGQDTRVDLPAIGIHTIENAHASGLRGIAIEAGASLIINRADVIAKADALSVFVLGI